MRRYGFALLATFCFALAAGDQAAAVDTQPVTRKWRYAVGGSVSTPFAVGDDGTVYFGAEDRYVYAIDAEGGLRWRHDTRRLPTGILALSGDGTVLLTVEPGWIIGVNPSGERAFSYRARLRPLAPAITADGNIVLAFESGALVFLTPAGRVVWERRFDATVIADPVLASNGTLYLATDGARVIAIDQDGRSRGATDLGEPVRRLYALADSAVLTVTHQGRVALYDSELRLIWKRRIEGTEAFTVHEPCGLGVAVSGNGTVETFRLHDGEPLGRGALPEAVRSVSAFMSAGCRPVLQTENTMIWFDSGETGPARRLDPQAVGNRRLERVTLDAAGRLLASSEEWIVHALGVPDVREVQTGDRTLPLSGEPNGWRGERGDDRLSGRAARGVREAEKGGAESAQRPLELLFLEELFFSGAGADRREALRELREVILEPRLSGRRAAVLDLLRRIIEQEPRSSGAATAEFRAEAVSLLGLVGDLPSARLLSRLSAQEEDETVRVAYLRAFARVRSDRSRGMLRSALAYLRSPGRSPALESAAIEALAALVSYNGTASHMAAWNAIAELSETGGSREVRSRAWSQLLAGRVLIDN